MRLAALLDESNQIPDVLRTAACFESFGHQGGSTAGDTHRVASVDGGADPACLNQSDQVAAPFHQEAGDCLPILGLDVIGNEAWVDGHVGIQNVAKEVFDASVCNTRKVRADALSQVGTTMTLSARLTEVFASARSVAHGGESTDPVLHGLTAI